ncbi:hypothetical protein A2716_00880 [candidate division WWE3 bacterium RIFCSPHIGHO2_01_FULL_40_23]|uniref:Uncharacterized protein n=1 Tax=candidate division WWE3 bacterium RIFCSPLOWO2_01_FULL_41_18 TaxID=1802625 RepID=A0A1F4VEH5_UNCKA|nr:MAG: hypothetical protein A2716_00880 [candidate division WWE3 bacterium RIFCSPHIGHO2_01_FULL_40_23]OGC55545.1 MAG: hypothetical protein A3A78_01150 [candidate division WWE3 bacterium RIFCSPLOWO2_01_FULL_41_18]
MGFERFPDLPERGFLLSKTKTTALSINIVLILERRASRKYLLNTLLTQAILISPRIQNEAL